MRASRRAPRQGPGFIPVEMAFMSRVRPQRVALAANDFIITVLMCENGVKGRQSGCKEGAFPWRTGLYKNHQMDILEAQVF